MTKKDTMTVDEAMRMLGCDTKAALARKLGMHRQALHVWGEEVPELRRYQVNALAAEMAAQANENAQE